MTLGLVMSFQIHQKYAPCKKKVDELDFITSNKFCYTKDTVKRVKRQATD